jgi:2-C-methyl-D-erythritol 4-phosphate cytidylyltransferase
MLMDEQNQISQSVDRKRCRVVRAPQTFRYQELLAAHDQARERGEMDYIDSATMMSAAGYNLHPVLGEPENIKITTPSDYYSFRAIVEAQENSQILGY